MTAAFATAGVGGLLALWPFVAALGPTADTVARRVIFNTRDLIGSVPVTLAVENRPIAIFRRTEEELAGLHDMDDLSGHAYRDRDSQEPRQPEWAKNWHRSLRAEIMVCEAMCTREGCVVSRTNSLQSKIAFENAFQCTCCGSRYDLAGRIFSGPAQHNLRVPPIVLSTRRRSSSPLRRLCAQILSDRAVFLRVTVVFVAQSLGERGFVPVAHAGQIEQALRVSLRRRVEL